MTGSAVFFTQVVGLSAAQVGLGLTIAGVASFIAAYPMGKVVDRFGPKRCWAISAAGQASLFTSLAVHRQLQRVRRDGCRHGGGRVARRRGVRLLHDRRAATRRAGRLARLHVLRSQPGLHHGRCPRRHRARLRLQQGARGHPVVHRRRVHGQRRGDPAAAQRLARRSHARGAQGQDPRARAAAEPRLDDQHLLRRRALDQPGAAQPRHPALAGPGDRRPAGAARVPVRHQHGDVHLLADGGRAGASPTCPRRCARSGSRARSSSARA